MNTHIVTPLQEISDDSEYNSDSSEDNIEYALTNNRGIIHNNFTTEKKTFVDRNNQYTYETTRNELFTKEITKFPLLIDSKNTRPSQSSGKVEDDNLLSKHIITNSSNYTIHFHSTLSKNKTAGFGELKNVIGFRLLKAIVPNSGYQITNNNKWILFVSDGSIIDVNLELTPGKYSVHELAAHLKSKINTVGAVIGGGTVSSNYNVTYNSTTMKYTITSDENFLFKWRTNFLKNKSTSYRLFGFYNIDDVEKTGNKVSDRSVDLSTHFVDLVIPEIPKIGCKKNYLGKSIIDRIPLNQSSGSLVFYESSDHYKNQNYFYPINLNQITIELYDDSTDFFYDAQNADNSFEFEVTTYNNKRKSLELKD
mgnify:CR=1 FL=1